MAIALGCDKAHLPQLPGGVAIVVTTSAVVRCASYHPRLDTVRLTGEPVCQKVRGILQQARSGGCHIWFSNRIASAIRNLHVFRRCARCVADRLSGKERRLRLDLSHDGRCHRMTANTRLSELAVALP